MRRTQSGLKNTKKAKLVIKPFKKKPQISNTTTNVALLNNAVNSVLSSDSGELNNNEFSKEAMYKMVEGLCTHGLAPDLYKKLFEDLKQHCNSLVQIFDDEAELQLDTVKNVWTRFCNQLTTLRSIFLFLDRTYVVSMHRKQQNSTELEKESKSNSAMIDEADNVPELTHLDSVTGLENMGNRLFCEALKKQENVLNLIVDGVVRAFNAQRRSNTHTKLSGDAKDPIDKTMHRLLLMFSQLDLYELVLEPTILSTSDAYYAEEGTTMYEQLGVSDYILYVEARIEDESQRVKDYMSSHTLPKLVDLVRKQLIVRFTEPIIKDGFKSLMESSSPDHLACLYRLFACIEKVDMINDAFFAHIVAQGTAVINDPNTQARMIVSLLEIRAKLVELIATVFQGDEKFTSSLKRAFETFLNEDANRPAELIAKYLDHYLRIGSRNITEQELEHKLDNAMELFSYILGKDVFQAFYKKDLAKRLLLQKSASVAVERGMIARIEAECGAAYTNKLKGMFKDMDFSQDIMKSYQEARAVNQGSNSSSDSVELNVHVLTTGSWPDYTPTQLALPPAVETQQEQFKEFYLGKYSSRKLVWINKLATCTLKAFLPKGRKEFIVSGFQAAVLMLFNDAKIVTFEQIKSKTKMDLTQLDATLKSLCVPSKDTKDPPLLKRYSPTKAKNLVDTDEFKVNMNFQSQRLRITINKGQIREKKSEQKDTMEKISFERQFAIDAAVVRIMKARKTLAHQELLAETFKQLKFTAKPTAVKKRIESLIERDYMERHEDDYNVYDYVA